MDARKQFSGIGWAYMVFLLIDLAVQTLAGAALALLQRLGIRIEISEMSLMFLSQISMYLFAFPVFWLMMRELPSWRKEETVRLSALQFLAWAVVCFGFTYIGNLVGQFLMGMVGVVTGNFPENPVDSLMEYMDPGMMFLTTVLIAPAMEELMFRKMLVDRLVPFGQKTAVILSGLAFGLFHGNFYQFFYACILGMIFAYLYSSTGRIRYNILLHMLINTVGGLLPLLIVRGSGGEVLLTDPRLVALGFLIIVSILASVLLACIFGWQLSWFKGWAPVPKRGIPLTVLTAPGVIGFLILCGVLFWLY